VYVSSVSGTSANGTFWKALGAALRVRDDADGFANELWELQRGEIVCVSEMKGDWGRLSINTTPINAHSMIGWVLLRNKRGPLLEAVSGSEDAQASWEAVKRRIIGELQSKAELTAPDEAEAAQKLEQQSSKQPNRRFKDNGDGAPTLDDKSSASNDVRARKGSTQRAAQTLDHDIPSAVES
jgi:hypothetical protein